MQENNQNSGWDGKSKASGLAYRIFYFILINGGIRFAYIFLYLVSSYYFLFDRKSNRYTRFYFREIWNFNRWKTFRYRFLSYYRFGQTILDKVYMLSGRTSFFRMRFNGRELLAQKGALNRGCILISAHVGNWEIAGHFLQNANRPVNVIMMDVEHQAIKDVLADTMKNRSFKIISLKDDFSHLMEIKNALANKEFICIHGDRILHPGRGRIYETSFLGRKAKFPRGPFDLAVRFNVPYLYVFASKESNRDYHFQAFEGHPDNTGNAEAMMDEYIQCLEKILASHPEQWFNYYDFWGIDEQPKIMDQSHREKIWVSPSP